jgi:hypothetical protein
MTHCVIPGVSFSPLLKEMLGCLMVTCHSFHCHLDASIKSVTVSVFTSVSVSEKDGKWAFLKTGKLQIF